MLTIRTIQNRDVVRPRNARRLFCPDSVVQFIASLIAISGKDYLASFSPASMRTLSHSSGLFFQISTSSIASLPNGRL